MVKVCVNNCELPHYCRGKCRRCYNRDYYRIYRQIKPEISRKAEKKYLATHPEYRKAKSTGFKKKIKRNMPKWVNRKEILEIYKNRPQGYHVDHIIPLNGANVSGLHVPWNLQYLPALENIKKQNKVLHV